MKLIKNTDYEVAVCGGGFAGISAAMTDDFSALDIKELQSKLMSDGVVLHERDIR